MKLFVCKPDAIGIHLMAHGHSDEFGYVFITYLIGALSAEAAERAANEAAIAASPISVVRNNPNRERFRCYKAVELLGATAGQAGIVAQILSVQ